jgi:hypothetical protein
MILSAIYVRAHECTMDERLRRRRRRTHSSAFKAEAVAVCHKPGASIAVAAMERSINANLLRRTVLIEPANGALTARERLDPRDDWPIPIGHRSGMHRQSA